MHIAVYVIRRSLYLDIVASLDPIVWYASMILGMLL